MSYKEKIEDLGFVSLNGLHFFSENNWKNRFSKRVEEVIELKLKPYAIYEFNSEPFILFFENRQNAEVHQWCWNLNSSPLIIIHEDNQIKIYNGFSFDNKKKFLRLLLENEKQVGDFNYINLVSGKFFEKYGKKFEEKNRVDYKLLENIKTARDKLINDYRLKPAVVNSLIGRLLFVRYLIDRKVKIGRYGELTGQDLLANLTDREKTYELFNYLKIKFNGNLFPIDEENEADVKEVHLEWLSKLLKGHELKTGQMNLFEFYDFSVIPIEFISNIYEFFLGEENQRREGAYYTPPFLVDYILKYTVDSYFKKDDRDFHCKVLDPACGSGIFLVETLRRLIHRYRELNPRCMENRESYKEELTKLLCDNIFGIDKDENAVKIAIFSLYIALLDYQEPKDIENFKFPELIGSNFFNADFFDLEHAFNTRLKGSGFDFIIGNPPWGNPSMKGEENRYLDYCEKRKVKIGRKEISQAFLLRASDFSSENTGCALIVTSKNLYNIESINFRKSFLASFKIDRIFELSSVRRQLFSKVKKSGADAIAPAAVIFYRFSHGEDTGNNIVRHISLKPNPLFDWFKIFVIEKYDYKEVLQDHFKNYDWLFKTLVYGNVLDFYFLKRMKESYPTIREAITGKVDDFLVGQGIMVGGGDKNDVSYLLNKPYIKTKDDLKPFYAGIRPGNTWQERYVHRNRDKELFNGNCLVMAEGLLSDLSSKAAYLTQKAVFKSSITAIRAQKDDGKKFLKMTVGLLNSSLFSYYIMMTGSSAAIEREQTHDKEKFDFFFNYHQEIHDIVEKIEQNRTEFYRVLSGDPGLNQEILNIDLEKRKIKNEKEFFSLRKSLDEAIYSTFHLSNQENALVQFVKDVSIPLFEGKITKQIYDKPSTEVIEEYARIFIDHFANYFRELGNYFSAEIYQAKYVLGINFVISEEKPANDIRWKKDQDDLRVVELLVNMSFSEISNDIFIRKDVKGFEENSFYVIKPKQYRLWHKAIAYLDINEFSDAILESGRKRLTE
ncbi:MAG: N-6 DNA methylase [Candidatus Aminicenantes bacterium]|nr:N-6 DNA methylase [Candidatus Aminicenantes bacterium]